MKSDTKWLALSIITLLMIVVQFALPVSAFADDATAPQVATGEPEAASAIIPGDPMWCPAANTTVTGDCVNATTVTLLLPLLASKDEAGVIYFFTPSPYSTNDVIFDGTNTDIDQLIDNGLTLQGGWDGTTTLGSTITFSGSSVFSVPVTVTNWATNVTLKNITVDGATTGDGIGVTTTGDINLENVTSSNNATSSGANLNNLSGTGNIILTGTNEFNLNNEYGLFAFSNGDITLNNITANGNTTGYGAALNNALGAGTGKITLTGTNEFNLNNEYGLFAFSKGDITLNNITANGNTTDYGAALNNDIAGAGTGKITLTGTNEFNENSVNGLGAASNGDITLNNITANGNIAGYGANLIGGLPGATGKITLTGTNAFNLNQLSGLAASSNGDITLNNITANENGHEGANLYNTSGGTRDITIACGKFNDNTQHGVQAALSGVLTLNGVTFSNNTLGDLNQTGGTLVTNASSCNPTTTVVSIQTASPQYSDEVTLRATVTPIQAGSDELTGLVYFYVGASAVDCSVAAPGDEVGSDAILAADDGVAEFDYAIEEAAGSYVATGCFYSATVGFGDSADDESLVVTKENATVTPGAGNLNAYSVISPTLYGGFTLTFTVRESGLPEPDQNAGAWAGEIGGAGLTVNLNGVGGNNKSAVCVDAAYTPGLPPLYTDQRVFTCTFTNVPVDAYEVDASVTGNYYIGSAYDVITVYNPAAGFVTGGGKFLYSENTPDRVNFGLVYNFIGKGKTVPRGNLLVIRRLANGDACRLKSNGMGAAAVNGTTASFSGKGNYGCTRPDGSTYDGAGNQSILGWVQDNGQGSKATGPDRFWVNTSAPNSKLAMPSPASTNARPLTGGNILVPRGK